MILLDWLAHLEELEKALIIYELLNNKGFKVCINIMQSAYLEDRSLIAEYLKGINLEALYLADSTGSMNSDDYNSK